MVHEVNVKETLIEATLLPNLAMKLMHLERIKNHPIAPILMDILTEVTSMSISKKILQDEFLLIVNDILLQFANRFGNR